VQMPPTPNPHSQGYVSYLAAMQLELNTAPWGEPQQLPALDLLKSLDDLDEEADDEEDEEVDDLEDEEDEEDLDEDYEDDEDEDEDDDEDEDEDEDDGGVKPLKMA
jgi:hypothetical protein